MAEAYSSDQPIRSRAEDLFHRSQFARRIAQTIAEQIDGSSLVVGIYGPWGDGKTSVLRMMEEELSSYSHVAVLRFNPWLFQSERELIQSFFDSIGEILNKKLATKSEEVGKWLKKYGSILAIAKISGVKDVGDSLSTVRLEDIKERVDATLRESQTRLVVFIDDVDRLDEAEIHALFKLLKLSGSFENIAYVVACDDDVVASSLGKRYGAGNEAPGREFLEKIVQVPLHLPSADPFALRQIVANGIQDLLHGLDLELASEERRLFWRGFIEGLELRLKTPRQAKRYVNALRFAVPLLRGEVRLVDQLLIEGVRVFFPDLYVQIRERRELFLADWPATGETSTNDKEFLEGALSRLSTAEKSAATRALKLLFPSCRAFSEEPSLPGSLVLANWTELRRICTSQCFDRYFSYAVEPPEFSDSQLSDLLRLRQWDLDLLVSRVYSLGGGSRLIRRLRERLDLVLPDNNDAAIRLCLALASNAELLSAEKPPGEQPSPLEEAAMLVTTLLSALPLDGPLEPVGEIVRASRSVRFAVAFVAAYKEMVANAQAYWTNLQCDLSTILWAAADLIQWRAEVIPPYRMPGVNSIAVFELWKDGSRDGEQIAMWLQKRFTQHPEEITEFLRPFWRRASEAFTDDLMKRFEVFEAEFGRFIAPALVAEAGISYFDQAKFEHLPWRDQEAVRVLMNIGQRHGLSPKELTSRPAGQGE